MGHSGLPKEPDSQNMSPDAIKCELVVPIPSTLSSPDRAETSPGRLSLQDPALTGDLKLAQSDTPRFSSAIEIWIILRP